MMDRELLQISNIDGQVFTVEKTFLANVLMFAWLTHLLALAVNILLYSIHPMAVEMSPFSKMFVYVFGIRFVLNGEEILKMIFF